MIATDDCKCKFIEAVVNSPFHSYLFICIRMFLNVDVRQFRAETTKLPEIASHPRSKTL